MFYKKENDTYIVRLERGEEIVSSVLTLAEREKITAASVTAIGAAGHIESGLYDVEAKKYDSLTYDGQYEITALNGNISSMDGKPYVHLHITAAGEDGLCFGGHLNSAVISATCEMFVRTFECELGRFTDSETGLRLFDIR